MSKLRVTNLTRFPYNLPVRRHGKVRLKAFDSVEGEFSGEYFTLLQASKAVKVEVIEDDNNSNAMHELRERYQLIVGKKPYHAWDAAELEKRIKEAMGE